MVVRGAVHSHPPRTRSSKLFARSSLPATRNVTPLSAATVTKKPPPPTGDERCLARGTTPLRRRVTTTTPFARTARPIAPCGDPVTGVPSVAAYWARVNASPLGARLRGLFRRPFRSRFAATAVLLPVPAGYSSSSWLRYAVVRTPYQRSRGPSIGNRLWMKGLRSVTLWPFLTSTASGSSGERPAR